MKVTSLKGVEAYIYSTVVLPLKGLNVPQLEIQSPISDELGHQWGLSLNQTPMPQGLRRNYQRTQAQRKRNWLVCLTVGRETFVVAEYNIKNHWVKLYEEPFKKLNAMMLLGKLHQAFNNNTPFTKVVVLPGNTVTPHFVPQDSFAYYDARAQRPMRDDYETVDTDDDSGEDWDY